MRFAAGLLLLSLAATSSGLCAEAMCSCIGPSGEFLVPMGAAIPADSRGIPFWGPTVVQWDGRELHPPDIAAFTIDRFVDGRRVPVAVELDVLSGPLISDGDRHQYTRLVLVSPRGGFVSGAQYLFTYSPRHDRKRRATNHPRDDPRETLVIVSDTTMAEAVSAGAARLDVGPPEHRSMRVAAGASCSVELPAVVADLTLQLPAALQRWHDVLLYTVTVDGRELWRPSASLCSYVAPGRSWQGHARELLYAACAATNDDDAARRAGRARYNLEPGAHEIVMTAWWPGVDAAISASATVDLSCNAADAAQRDRP